MRNFCVFSVTATIWAAFGCMVPHEHEITSAGKSAQQAPGTLKTQLYYLSTRGNVLPAQYWAMETDARTKNYGYSNGWLQSRLHPVRFRRALDADRALPLSRLEGQARPLFRGLVRACPALSLHHERLMPTTEPAALSKVIYGDSGGYAQISLGDELLWVSNYCVEPDPLYPEDNNFVDVDNCGPNRWLPRPQGAMVAADNSLLHNTLYYLDHCLDQVKSGFQHIYSDDRAIRYRGTLPDGSTVFLKWYTIDSSHNGALVRDTHTSEWVYYFDRDILGFDVVPATVVIHSGRISGVPDTLLRKWIPGDVVDNYSASSGGDGIPEEWHKKLESQLEHSSAWKVAVLHYLLGAYDHHKGRNILITPEGEFVSFDNERFEPSTDVTASTLFDMLRDRNARITPEVLSRLQLVRSMNTDLLSDYLSSLYSWALDENTNEEMLRCWFLGKLDLLLTQQTLPRDEAVFEVIGKCSGWY